MMAGMYFRTSCLTCTLAPLTPTVAVSSSSNIICSGNQAILTASGAGTYTWNTTATTSSIVVSPTTTTSCTVYGSNPQGCGSAIFTQSVSLCAGLTEYSIDHQIKIYPNPSKGIFKIELVEKIENLEIVIYNSIGELVYKQVIKEGLNTIDVSKFSPGYYQGIITEKGKQVYREKLIVE
jgi:hypothetical protein